MHTCILRNARSKVRFEDLENTTAEFFGIIGHLKGILLALK
jgi:hypothetical protein